MKKIFTLIITGFLFLSFLTLFHSFETCKATTLHVGTGQAYSTIQDAIDDANESDTVYIHSGTYNENLVINRSITLTGEGSGTTIIKYGGNGYTIKVTGNNVSISQLSIENTGLGSSFSSIFLNSVSNCNIEYNIIKDAGNGLYLVSSNTNTIEYNTIEENNIGIYLSNADSNTIRNNDIQNNNANGIYIRSTSTSNTIYLNDFSDNTLNNAYDLGINSWSYNSQGNYWDDYNDYDSNDDGIGDNPYDIDGGSNQDEYPLGDFLTENNKPIATIVSINPTSVTYGDTVSFVGHGTDPDSGDYISDYSWTSSRDGSLSSSASFSTSSLSVGTHTIRFKVRDNNDEWSTEKTSQVTVSSGQSQKPTATIVKPNTATAFYGNIIEFQGYGTDDGIVVEYSWRSSTDGVLSGEKYFTKNDLTIGEHIIYFKVRDNDDQWSNEVSTTITIEPDPNPENNPPTADANGPYLGYTNTSISFDGSDSSDPDEGDSLTYNWYFGDGNNSEEMSPSHTYSSKGNYTVMLTVFDSYGAQHSITTYANISEKPSSQNGKNKKEEGIPGFELVFILIAIAIFLINRRLRK